VCKKTFFLQGERTKETEGKENSEGREIRCRASRKEGRKKGNSPLNTPIMRGRGGGESACTECFLSWVATTPLEAGGRVPEKAYLEI